MAQTLVDVPPTSINTPSIRRRWRSAPATLAAGPDRTVTIGLLRKVLMSVTPPSPFIIRTGATIFSFLTADSTNFAVLVVLGKMPPLIAAVRVLFQVHRLQSARDLQWQECLIYPSRTARCLGRRRCTP